MHNIIKQKNTDLTILHVISGLKTIIDLFSGPFLITYFIKISAEEAFTLSVYNIVLAICCPLGAFISGRIARNKFKIGMFRVGIILNLIYILFFILFKDKILGLIPVVGTLCGFSAGCYWYPLNLIKSEKIRDKDGTTYFVLDHIIVTVVSIIGPLVLGTVISRLNYIQTAYAIAVISALQLIMTMLLGPIQETEKPGFSILDAIKLLWRNKSYAEVMISHGIQGMTTNNGALLNLITIEVMLVLSDEQDFGILTTCSNILMVIIVAVLSRILSEKRKKFLILLCGIIPVIIFVSNRMTGIPWLVVLFYGVYNAATCGIYPVHEQFMFSVAGRKEIGIEHKEEFFLCVELSIAAGRLISFGLMLICALSHSVWLMEILKWFLLAASLFMVFLVEKNEVL